MTRLPAIPSLLLLSLSFSVSAGTLYNYVGPTMTCRGTCVPGTPAINATLEFSGLLAASTEYVNQRFADTFGAPAGATNVDVGGFLTLWSMTDGTRSVSPATPGAVFSLHLQTDATGSIASWYLGTSGTLSATESLILGTQSASGTSEDDDIYQIQLAAGGTDTSWWQSSTPGSWSVQAPQDGNVPEPATLALCGLSLGLIVLVRRRRF
jgi:hypothetical protein